MDLEAIKLMAENKFRLEYMKARDFLNEKKPMMNPKMKEEIARRIAKKKTNMWLEKNYSLRLEHLDELIRHKNAKLEDLL